MPAEIVMPRMSDTMEQGRIVRWLKKPGDHVEKGEPLAEIETDKAVMQLESYEAGILDKILLPEGESAPVGQPIAEIATGREAAEREARVAAAPAAVARPAERPAAAPPPAPAPTAPAERVKASPIARRIAEERGIDLSQIRGTGPGGRVTREDVEAYLSREAVRAEEERERAAAPAPPAPAPRPAPPPPAAPEVGPTEIVELSRMRRTIGERMTESKTTIPHFYVTTEIDMAEALALRQRLNAAWAPETIGITDMIVRAAALALRKFPDVNASYRDGHLERHLQVNVGIAVAMPEEGLMVPVVRNAGEKGLREIARETKGLVERARSGKALPGDFGGGTFTISNLGMYDVEEFIAIITPPEAAILAVASIKQQPVAVDGQVKVSERMRVTLSGDHRVFAGETAARFLQEVKRLLENPLDLLQ